MYMYFVDVNCILKISILLCAQTICFSPLLMRCVLLCKVLLYFQSGCDDMQFAVELINQLVQAFLAAHDTRAQVTLLALK